MAEVQFARTFLSALDGRPNRLSPDHVEDPKNLPGRPPYILPRMPKSMSRPEDAALAPGQESSITILAKSLRNPPLDIKLSSRPPTTSIVDIKMAVSNETRIPIEKIKILHKKKPVADSKLVKDLLEGGEVEIEFSIMVMGGAAAIPPPAAAAQESSSHPVAAGPSGAEVLETTEFWDDLHGFLLQRLKDEKEAGELTALFKASWEKR